MTTPTAQVAIDIEAPIERVWGVLCALHAYPAWNPFVVQVDGATQPRRDALLRLHVRWHDGGGTTSGERVTRVEPPGTQAFLAWRFRGVLPSLHLVRAERVQTLTALGPGRTRYESVEVFHGLLAWAVPLERVRQGFARMAQALKARAEAAG